MTNKLNTAEGESLGLIVEVLLGEYMRMLIDPLKDAKKPWSELSEDIQNTIISRAETEARIQITNMCKLIASGEHDALAGELHNIQIKGKEIRAQVDFSLGDPKKHELYEFANKQVVVVLIDPDDYFVGEGKPEADLDQPALSNFD